MVDSALPVCARPRCALRIRDRDHGHIPKPLIQPEQLGSIETAVQSRYIRNRQMPADEIVKAARMEMNQVELTGPLHYVVHQQDFAR